MNNNDLGRVPSEPGSREPSPTVSAASGFDPSRGELSTGENSAFKAMMSDAMSDASKNAVWFHVNILTDGMAAVHTHGAKVELLLTIDKAIAALMARRIEMRGEAKTERKFCPFCGAVRNFRDTNFHGQGWTTCANPNCGANAPESIWDQRAGDPDEYMSVSIDRAGKVTSHNAYDANFDEMADATRHIIAALQDRLDNRLKCPFASGKELRAAPASAIEARRAATLGAVHESAVAKPDAHTGPSS